MSFKKVFSYLFLTVFCFCILYAVSCFSLNPAIDTGRELYIPLRILNGEVLYKDIFNIYGPFAYQINAFAYKLLGAKLHALRVFGIIDTMLVISSLWFILKELFSQQNEKITVFSKLSDIPFRIPFFAFILIILASGISNSIFNYILPYSFAMTYGICFFLFSLLFFIKFSKSYNPNFAYLASLFAGSAFCCKYEFACYSIFLMLFITFCKKINTKNIIFSFLSFMIVPCLSFGLLFLRGMSFEDLSKTAQTLKTMADTQAIKYLYSNFTGTYFDFKVFKICLFKTLILLIIGAIVFFSQKFYKKDIFLTLIVFIFSVFGLLYVGTTGFSLFAVINILLFLLFIKKVFHNKPVLIYMVSVILLSLKTFFALNIQTYGIYTLPFLIISIFVFLKQIILYKNDKIKIQVINTYSIITMMLLICCIVPAVIQNLKNNKSIVTEELNFNNYYEKLTKITITKSYIANPLNQAIAFINQKTKQNDRIVVLPETQFLNFITKHPADNLYDSLTPMYFETFGEYNIIGHFKKSKPEYFILNNRNTSDYGKRYICEDYGQDFCSFVKDNYKLVETFGEKQYILKIFKRRDLK